MKVKNIFVSIVVMLLAFSSNVAAQTSGFPELDEAVAKWKEGQKSFFGYPANQKSELHDFYEWYVNTGMEVVNLNNAGDPMTDDPWKMSSQKFEREVIEWFAPLYGYDLNDTWGIVTHSGTDGNNHGIYFGAKMLYNTTNIKPVLYVSDEAHYSNMRLADLQNLDMKLIKSDDMGRMIPEELEKELDTSRPVLMVYAMGSTFKGAIDNMEELNGVLSKHTEILAIYRHLDAALFGGYLPFTKHKDMVDMKKQGFESISISGHKFFGIDSPSGLFICTRKVYESQNSFNVPYLNNNMRMINCSRDAIQPLKFWWLIKKVGMEKWTEQATSIMECTQYLADELEKINWPHWLNEYSNTVFFMRPSKDIIDKYLLAGGHDERFGGDLNHIVVMQHITKEAIDTFIDDLKKEATSTNAVTARAKGTDTHKYRKNNKVLIQKDNTTYSTSGTRLLPNHTN